MDRKLTYKDFKEGQIVTCVSIFEKEKPTMDFWEQHLTVGKSYKIEDLEWRYHDKICVRSDNGKTSMFVPIELFDDKQILRDNKIEEILKGE